MKAKMLVEVEEEIGESIQEGDIVLLHNTIEFILCIISFINKNKYIGTIVSILEKTKKYNIADNIEFSKRNILERLSKDE
jgi:hypothetical protein